MDNSYMITSTTITIFSEDEVFTVDASHPRFDSIKGSLKDLDYNTAIDLIDMAKQVADFTDGHFSVIDGCVQYQGKVLDNSLTQRILRMMQEGFDITPMVRFMGNLMQNPSGRAVKELYRFLESNNLPITKNGRFMAYKNVSTDYLDRHTGTFDNSVGQMVEMPRNEVMDDPNETCSAGLHFCSIEYLQGFWGTSGHTMLIEINPADVVSIPVDYNNSKGRCSKYYVVAEHASEDVANDDVLSDGGAVYTQEDIDDAFLDGMSEGYNDGYHDAYEG